MKLATACCVLLAGYNKSQMVSSFAIEKSLKLRYQSFFSSSRSTFSQVLPLYYKTGSELEDNEPGGTVDSISNDVFTNTMRTLRTFIPNRFIPEGSGILEEKNVDRKKSRENFERDADNVEILFQHSTDANIVDSDINQKAELNSYITALLMDSDMFEQKIADDSEKSTLEDQYKSAWKTKISTSNNIAATILSTLQQQLAFFESNVSSTTSLDTLSISPRVNNIATSTYQGVEPILQEFTAKMNLFFLQASASVQTGSANNAQAFQELLQQASMNVNVSTKGLAMAVDKFVEETVTLARENGLDVGIALESALSETKYIFDVGTAVLVKGYVQPSSSLNDASADAKLNNRTTATAYDTTKPLFDDYIATSVSSSSLASSIAGEMAKLAGCVYEPTMEMQAKELGHTIVASGSTCDVSWLITDGILSNVHDVSWHDDENEKAQPSLVRTITLKGFDAGDELVDRERLLGNIWTANPEKLSENDGVVAHSGLLSVARCLYEGQFRSFIDGLAPSHKIILNGHSIGGSLSNLILMILVNDKGADWVKQHVLRVFTFGAPPVASVISGDNTGQDLSHDSTIDTVPEICVKSGPASLSCDVLSSLGLPCNMVYGFVQPWDPIVRLFSSIDPLYPLVDDIGPDGNTVWASGPSRTLRPVVRSIVEEWEKWPSLRERFRETAKQNYLSVGVQHLLMPEPSRYMTDRLVSVNLAVPDVETVVTMPPCQLMDALEDAFPLDTFAISYVPAAVRSFIHHFHPAYVATVDKFCRKEHDTGKKHVEKNTVANDTRNFFE